MSLKAKRLLIAVLGFVFLGSLLLVMWMEIVRKQEEAGLVRAHPTPPEGSAACVECHKNDTPGIVDQWAGSTHAAKGVGCYDCHKAKEGELDAWMHEGQRIATLVTPADCGRCHEKVFDEFTASHHARGGDILHSLDNKLAEMVEGARESFHVRGSIPGSKITEVNGMAFAQTGCQQCHGSMVALKKIGGGQISIDDFRLGDDEGKLTDAENVVVKKVAAAALSRKTKDLTNAEIEALEPESAAEIETLKTTAANGKEKVDDLTKPEREALDKAFVEPKRKKALKTVFRDEDGKPLFVRSTWPNTGIGRLNIDGSLGSCSACHSRHDFSPRRARQPENCGKCHLGPDHPQKEIYEESKHGIAYRDLKDKMNLDSESWVLGKDYTQAPTCATCHMSANTKDDKITHDPGKRISWTNRPPVSMVMDTDKKGDAVKETDPQRREELVVELAAVKRERMKRVCLHCHTSGYVNAFYTQYDSFVVLYNEKFAKPGKAIMGALKKQGLTTATPFDEEIEWTWFYLWHHEGRRARHGASMMAPDYAHWHGTYEVAERFYMGLIPQAREIVEHAREEGKTAEADAVTTVIDEILARPEHTWFEKEKQD